MWINVTYFHNAVSKHDLWDTTHMALYMGIQTTCINRLVVYAAYGGIGGQIYYVIAFLQL